MTHETGVKGEIGVKGHMGETGETGMRDQAGVRDQAGAAARAGLAGWLDAASGNRASRRPAPRWLRSLARLLLLPVLAGTAFASLSPIAPSLVPLPARTDLLAHGTMHLALGLTLALALDPQRRRACALIALCVTGFEIGQIAVPGRGFDAADLAANAAGAALALLLAARLSPVRPAS